MGDYRKIGAARIGLALAGVRMMQAALFARKAGPAGSVDPFGHGNVVFWEAMDSDYADLASVDDLAALEAALEGDDLEAIEHLVETFSGDGVVADDPSTWSVVLDELASDLENALQ